MAVKVDCMTANDAATSSTTPYSHTSKSATVCEFRHKALFRLLCQFQHIREPRPGRRAPAGG
jgi:hypothetical protein